MNTISKIGLIASFFLVGCIQGPWTFWPKDPPLYRGIWVYAHVVAGRPLTEVCFEPIIPLEQTSTRDFAFYRNAQVQISGRFNGSNQNLDLSPRSESPNCFDGPSDQIPARNQAYQLRAEFQWDSSGVNTTTILTASTRTPEQFSLRDIRVLGSSKLDTVFRNDSIVSILADQFGESIRDMLTDPATLDTLAGEYQKQLVGLLGDFAVPLANGDTVSYLNPPLDLTSPYKFGNERSDDVDGVLITQYYDPNGARGLSSFDLIGSQPEPDSAERTDFGHRHRLWFLQSFYNEASQNNYIDTLTLSNAYLYIGDNLFYFYAVPREYTSYLNTSIQGAEDSRIRAKSNIQGGYGVFSGMLVDSIRFYVKALPGSRTYPFERTRWLACRELKEWEDISDCRRLIPTYCADSLSVSPECRAYAVAAAIDSGYSWDSLMVSTTDTSLQTSVRLEGEERWCIRNAFPVDSTLCDSPRKACLQSKESSTCKTHLWNWCADLGWPIDSLGQCGSGFVSWFRLEDIDSPVMERERDLWCDQNSDPQCKF